MITILTFVSLGAMAISVVAYWLHHSKSQERAGRYRELMETHEFNQIRFKRLEGQVRALRERLGMDEDVQQSDELAN